MKIKDMYINIICQENIDERKECFEKALKYYDNAMGIQSFGDYKSIQNEAKTRYATLKLRYYEIINNKEKEYLKESADYGNYIAQNNYGVLLIEEALQNNNKNLLDGIEYIRKSKEQHYDVAFNNIGLCYEFGLIDKDLIKAESYYKKVFNKFIYRVQIMVIHMEYVIMDIYYFKKDYLQEHQLKEEIIVLKHNIIFHQQQQHKSIINNYIQC